MVEMLIAQLSDVHVGGARFRPELLHRAIEEVNAAAPDLVVVAGDLTDDGYPDQYPEARAELDAIECPEIVLVPGNHDARNVGYIRFEEEFGARDSRLHAEVGGVELALVAVDTSKPDIDEGEVGREHYGWIAEGFDGDADLRVFVCHHHLMPVPGTGRERNQVLDAGDVIALLRQLRRRPRALRPPPRPVRLAGRRHVHRPLRNRLDSARRAASRIPSYNLIRVEDNRISVELRIPGGEGRSLGEYPRDWPKDLSARHTDVFVPPPKSPPLAND